MSKKTEPRLLRESRGKPKARLFYAGRRAERIDSAGFGALSREMYGYFARKRAKPAERFDFVSSRARFVEAKVADDDRQNLFVPKNPANRQTPAPDSVWGEPLANRLEMKLELCVWRFAGFALKRRQKKLPLTSNAFFRARFNQRRKKIIRAEEISARFGYSFALQREIDGNL